MTDPITTPEQMREAAIDAVHEADSLELATHGGNKIAERIRAIPTAQQPEAANADESTPNCPKCGCGVHFDFPDASFSLGGVFMRCPNINCDWFSDMRFNLPEQNAVAPQPMAVTVKPLVWEDADEGFCTKWSAAALGGHYQLVALDKGDDRFSVNFSWGRPLSFWFIQGDPDEFGPTGPKKFATIEAAKAAAQADYEARVMSAIVATPARDVRAAALREAEKALRDWQDDLNANSLPETAITVGSAADLTLALIDKDTDHA